MSENITRPIIGIENRTPQEVFDIMVARIGASPAPLPNVVGIEAAWRQYTTDRKPSIWGREVFEAGFRAALSSPMEGTADA